MGKTITMSVVSDSGPIISFARAKKLHIIQEVYRKIIIPSEVYSEIVVKGKGRAGAEEIDKATWVSIQKPRNQAEVKIVKESFDLGESEAMVLAQELKATFFVDERIVIKEARKRGLKVTTTHLTLEVAKKRGLITSVKKELDDLIVAGFRTTQELVAEILQKVGE